MTLEERIIGLIGIANRGKYLTYGEDIIFKIKKHKMRLIIIALDSSDSFKKEMEQLAIDNNLSTIYFLTKEQLGQIVKKDSVNALGVLNSTIAKRIEELQEEVENYVKKAN